MLKKNNGFISDKKKKEKAQQPYLHCWADYSDNTTTHHANLLSNTALIASCWQCKVYLDTKNQEGVGIIMEKCDAN